MATSGSFLTSPSGAGGGCYYNQMIFEWWRTGWGRTGSVGYHNISYRLKSYGGTSGCWVYFYNGSMNVAGAGYSWGKTQVWGAGATSFGDYSNTIYTDAAGNASFGASAQGGIYYNTINTSGSSSWSLDNIPMYGDITSIVPGSGLTDEISSITVDWYKHTGTAHIWFRLDDINNTDGTHHKIGMSDPYVWSSTSWANWLRTSMVNTNSTRLFIYYGDDLDSNGSVDRWDDPNIYTITIKNDLGQANPTFTDYTYQDTNSTTSSITGNNQVLIQGKSTLQATVSTANKATPNKNANMGSYVFSIGGYSQSSPYSAVSNVVHNIGTVSDVSGTQTLSVKAVDSRTNFKTVSKSISIIPYSSPAFVPEFNVRYTNDFDTSSGITVVASGTKIAGVSPIRISGTDKNSVNGTSGVRFDVKKGSGSYTGTWVNVATSFGSGTGDITTTIATLQSAILTKINGLTADNTVKWYVKFEITDALETVTKEILIDVGKPIFRIGNDGYVYNNEQKIITQHNKAVATLYSSTTPFTMNWGTAWTSVKVPLDTFSSEYDPFGKLTYNSNGIKIGSGISKVLVSGVFGIYNNSNGNDTIPQVWKNSTNLSTFAYYNATAASVIYAALPLRSLVVDVTTDDIIYMYCSIGGTGNRSIFGYTTLVVEVIE